MYVCETYINLYGSVHIIQLSSQLEFDSSWMLPDHVMGFGDVWQYVV